jgi:hypothetical protein
MRHRPGARQWQRKAWAVLCLRRRVTIWSGRWGDPTRISTEFGRSEVLRGFMRSRVCRAERAGGFTPPDPRGIFVQE